MFSEWLIASRGRSVALSYRRSTVGLAGEELVLDPGSGTNHFRRIPKPSHTTDPRPMRLGTRGSLSQSQIEEIKDELRKRHRDDQRVRQPVMKTSKSGATFDHSLMNAMKKVDQANTAWLRKLVAELG